MGKAQASLQEDAPRVRAVWVNLKRIKNRICLGFSMAKQLGQIHTANFTVTDIQSQGIQYLLDTSSVLSNQLNHMVRQAGNYMKVVGVDMTVSEYGGNQGGGSINGMLRYYAPTRGRCEAIKSAFRAVREGAKLQGVRLTDNKNYDFRVPLRNTSLYSAPYGDLTSKATIDGTNEIVLSNTDGTSGVFDIHNANIEPSQGGVTPTFSQGYGIPGTGGAGTDFVLNEGAIFDPAMTNIASVELEEIPFQVSFDPQGDGMVTNWMWRPDPALYLAVLTGQFELYIDEIDVDDDADALTLDIAVHIAGWKSVMGNPDRKRRSKRKSSKKTAKKTGGKS